MKKKKVSTSFVVDMQVYPFQVMVSIGQDDNQLGRVLDKYNLTEDDIRACAWPSPYTKGRAVLFSTNASIIRLRGLPETSEDYGTLAHEIFHIASFVLDRIGTPLQVNVSDESYAYLIGYLTTEIFKKINKYY